MSDCHWVVGVPWYQTVGEVNGWLVPACLVFYLSESKFGLVGEIRMADVVEGMVQDVFARGKDGAGVWFMRLTETVQDRERAFPAILRVFLALVRVTLGRAGSRERCSCFFILDSSGKGCVWRYRMRNAVGRGLDNKRRGIFWELRNFRECDGVGSYIDVDSHGVVVCGSGSTDVVGLGPEGCVGFV